MAVSWSLYIVMGTRFIVVIAFVHVSGSDCGFTKKIYKAAGLIMG